MNAISDSSQKCQTGKSWYEGLNGDENWSLNFSIDHRSMLWLYILHFNYRHGIRMDEGKFVDGTGVAPYGMFYMEVCLNHQGQCRDKTKAIMLAASSFNINRRKAKLSDYKISMFDVTSATGSPNHTTPSCSNFIPPLIRLASNDDQLFPFRSE